VLIMDPLKVVCIEKNVRGGLTIKMKIKEGLGFEERLEALRSVFGHPIWVMVYYSDNGRGPVIVDVKLHNPGLDSELPSDEFDSLGPSVKTFPKFERRQSYFG
jgi:hypothetical protein